MSELSPKPYTIKLFMPDGNPDAFKMIVKMNRAEESSQEYSDKY